MVEMLTMTVEPVSEELVTEPVIYKCGTIEPAPTETIDPEIHVEVGAVNPLKEALDKTCVDNCSKEFEEIGEQLNKRHALLAKVKIFGDDLQAYQQQIKRHARQYAINRVNDRQMLNQLGNEVTDFNMQFDKHFKMIEEQFNELQSMHKSNEKRLEQVSRKTDKELKSHKQMFTDISKKMGTATYEISNLTSYNKMYVNDLVTLKDLVEKLSDTVRSLSNGGMPALKPKSKTTFLDADDDKSEALSVHELKFSDPDANFKPINVPHVQVQAKPITNSQLKPSTPTIAIISPTESSASSSLSSFDNIADIPSTVDEVEETYANNRDVIQGNTNKLDVLYETDDELDALTDSSFNTLSTDELNVASPMQRQSISLDHLDQLLKALKEDDG
ncbi:hypothetical protein ACHWQZ_G018302 [Mnemiopsis leidyi]